jgi:hypothetical protein
MYIIDIMLPIRLLVCVLFVVGIVDAGVDAGALAGTELIIAAPEMVVGALVAPEMVVGAPVAPEMVVGALVAPEMVVGALVAPEIVTDALVVPEIVTDALVAPEMAAGALVPPEIDPVALVSPEMVPVALVDPVMVTAAPAVVTDALVDPVMVTAAPVDPVMVTAAPVVVTDALVDPVMVTAAPVDPVMVTAAPVDPVMVTAAPVVVTDALVDPVLVTGALIVPEMVTDATGLDAGVLVAPAVVAGALEAPAMVTGTIGMDFGVLVVPAIIGSAIITDIPDAEMWDSESLSDTETDDSWDSGGDPVPDVTENVKLGTAGDFAILSGSKLNADEESEVHGDVGAIGDMTIPNVFGTRHTGRSPYLNTAVLDMDAAYMDASTRIPCTSSIVGSIGGRSFTPGVYSWGTDVFIDDDVYIEGDATDVVIFQTTGNVVAGAHVNIILTGGIGSASIVWQVAGFMHVHSGAYLLGIFLVKSHAVFMSGSGLNGRLLVQSSVTLEGSNFRAPV